MHEITMSGSISDHANFSEVQKTTCKKCAVGREDSNWCQLQDAPISYQLISGLCSFCAIYSTNISHFSDSTANYKPLIFSPYSLHTDVRMSISFSLKFTKLFTTHSSLMFLPHTKLQEKYLLQKYIRHLQCKHYHSLPHTAWPPMQHRTRSLRIRVSFFSVYVKKHIAHSR
jgi:hypothetical protein